MSSSYHPETDGQSEVTNRCLEQYLRCFAFQQPRKWSIFLPWAEYWYNTSFHISTGVSPFFALYGHHPPMLPHYEISQTPVHEVDQSLLSRDTILQELKINLSHAANQMKQRADLKRRAMEF